MRNTETVIGIVVYAGLLTISALRDKEQKQKSFINQQKMISEMHVLAGHETKAMQNNSGPRYKRSKLERRLNVDVLWSVVLLLLMCFVAAVGQYYQRL